MDSGFPMATLPHIRLGRTELSVGQLGFGGIPIQRLTRARAVRLIEAAVDRGITFFDTARGYSDSEDKLGAALKHRRDQVVLASKSPALDADGMRQALDASLTALRTDRIDLYQLHNLMTWDALQRAQARDGALTALKRARKLGKIRFIGLTSHSVDLLARVLKEAPLLFDTIQVPFNFVGDESGRTLLPAARAADVGFIAMKPLGGGALEHPDLALRYVLQYADVVTIPGMETMKELKQNAQLAVERRPLTAEEEQLLGRLRDKLGKQFCRKCNYCQPCPQGIAIHLALGARTLLKRFDRRTIAGWCRDVMRKAAVCKQCGLCETRCPYQLPIRALLEENVALFRKGLKPLNIAWGEN